MRFRGILRAAAVSVVVCVIACEAGDDRSVFAWSVRVGRDDGPDDRGATVIAVDSRGNSCVVNVAYAKPERVSKGVILDVSRVRSLDPSGRVRWQRDLALPDAPARALDLAIDRDDSVVALGEGTNGQDWIARIDRRGKLVLPPTTFDAVANPRHLAVDALGNVFVVGNTVGRPPNYPSDIAVAKLSPDGELLWMHTVHATEHDYAEAVAVDAEGGVLVGASIGEAATARDVWFQRYDADGVERWGAPVLFKTEQPDTLAGLAILPDDSFMAVGSAGSDGLGPSMAWLMHYGADGSARWSQPMLLTDEEVRLPFDAADDDPFPGFFERDDPDSLPRYASADAVALDPKGHPVVIGVRNETVWLQHFEERDGVLGPCGGDSTRCSVPTVYESGHTIPAHRALAIDRDGRMLVVGDRLDNGAHDAGVWLAKLAAHVFSHEHE